LAAKVDVAKADCELDPLHTIEGIGQCARRVDKLQTAEVGIDRSLGDFSLDLPGFGVS